jgi:hypothetical protein
MVEDIDRAVEAVGKIEQISRARCRREFEQRFTDRHMAEDYIRIYQQLLSRSSTHGAAWNINNCSGVTTADLPRSLSATGRTRRGELIALCSVPFPVVPESRVVLQNISLQPTQKVQEVRSDFFCAPVTLQS